MIQISLAGTILAILALVEVNSRKRLLKFLSNLLRRRMKKGKQSTVMGKLPFLKEVVVRTRIRLCYTCKIS